MPLIRVQLMELPPMLHDVLLAVVENDPRLQLAGTEVSSAAPGSLPDRQGTGVDVVVVERDAAPPAAVRRLLGGVPGLRVVAVSATSGETEGYVMRPEHLHYGPLGLDDLADLLAGQAAVDVPSHRGDGAGNH